KLYTVEEMDVVRRKNVTAFLEIRKREAERVNGVNVSDGIISKEPRNEKEPKDDTPATQLNATETNVTVKTEISYSQDCDDEVLSDEESMEQALTLALGYGLDWKEYRNPQGYTHFEELLIYQPRNWKMHAREYMLRYGGNIDSDATKAETPTHDAATGVPIAKGGALAFVRNHLVRVSSDGNVDLKESRPRPFQHHRVANITLDGYKEKIAVRMKTPISVVLFHPEIQRCDRYGPLNFLLSYGAKNPLGSILQEVRSSARDEDPDGLSDQFLLELSPLDYLFDFRQRLQTYGLVDLRKLGAQAKFPRLCYIKELAFGEIIGQRAAKQLVSAELVRFISSRIILKNSSQKQPLSMIFAGPSGVGKTELAAQLATLMNKPGAEGNPSNDNFLKVDCGKLTYAEEIFGLSGSYRGAEQGSALNNFILRKSQDRGSLGIVLLDEIEKASQDVIHALYRK
ncbi:MAG: hypothetical protein SGILL_004378, partial [Bacillariaceae sp.]